MVDHVLLRRLFYLLTSTSHHEPDSTIPPQPISKRLLVPLLGFWWTVFWISHCHVGWLTMSCFWNVLIRWPVVRVVAGPNLILWRQHGLFWIFDCLLVGVCCAFDEQFIWWSHSHVGQLIMFCFKDVLIQVTGCPGSSQPKPCSMITTQPSINIYQAARRGLFWAFDEEFFGRLTIMQDGCPCFNLKTIWHRCRLAWQ